MHYYVCLAATADSADGAKEMVESFIHSFPEQSDYHIIEDVEPLVGFDGKMIPAFREEIDTIISYKDTTIAKNIRMFVPLSSPEEVVAALNTKEKSHLDDTRSLWTKALSTGGRSLALHHYEEGHERAMALYWLKSTLQLMNDHFHNSVGFFDVEENTTSLHWVEQRIAEDPTRQWFVRVDMHN